MAGPISADCTSADIHPPSLRCSQSPLRLLTELTRERVSLRYLYAWTELHKPEFINRNAFPPDHPMPEAAACHDTGLAAFAQLAALRIGVRRAFITVMSRDTEYVLVEATRTMSLQSDFTSDAKDKSWLGTSCFTRSDGINHLALDGWRKARSYRQRPESDQHYYTNGMSPHWCIINDAVHDSDVKQLPFVSRAESPRFYFSLPLRDFEGTVIGSLSLLDDKPRYGVSASDMLFCEDLCDTVAQHLYHSTIATQRQRSERLILALGTFNNGGSSLRDWWIRQDNQANDRGRRRKETVETSAQQNARFDEEYGVEEDRSVPVSKAESPQSKSPTSVGQNNSKKPISVGDANGQATINRLENNISGVDFKNAAERSVDSASEDGKSPSRSVPLRTKPLQKERELRKARKPFEPAEEMKRVYSRASNLLRESLGAFGVAFFDASTALVSRPGAQAKSDTESTDQPSSPSNTTISMPSDASKSAANSDTDGSDNSERRSRPCKLEAYSIPTHSGGQDDTRRLLLSEGDLAKLISTYPSGKVFNYARGGNVYSGSEDNTGSSESATGNEAPSRRVGRKFTRHARMLRKAVGSANDPRSVAFFPIWDSTTERYRSCLICWTLHTSRFLDANEDITYMASFAHSLRAEISRVETIASDIAKGKFISSVSHELRSPLHGILAGVELLQSSQLTPFQTEMAGSVALAGRTLLDTVNHILDYSKISNLTHEQKKDRSRADAARHKIASTDDQQESQMINLDLARLTEEVLESVVTGYRFSQSFGQSSSAAASASNVKGNSPNPQNAEEGVSVTLDIEKRASWTTPMTPGGWTRILTNIVGNALKYTPTGTISVRLFATENAASSIAGRHTSQVTLQVEDSGIGMSNEFISNHMFTPFRQANSHSAGTGLGLSIVREVAKELSASITVDSEIGTGSTISVKFAAQFKDEATANGDEDVDLETTEPYDMCMLSPRDLLPQPTSFETDPVMASVQHAANGWLGCKISQSRSSTPNLPANTFCLISESHLSMLEAMQADMVQSLMSALNGGGSRLVVIGRSIASSQPAFAFEDFAGKPPLYIHQPIGPRKLSRVIKYAQDSTVTLRPDLHEYYNKSIHPPSPQIIKGGTPGLQANNPNRQSTYFDLPKSDHNRISSLMTPRSFTYASSLTTFERAPSTGEAVTSSETPSQGEPDRQGRETMLLVEDNNINMRLLVALMKKQNLPYECAENGLEALEKYKQHPLRYSLILMDMSMPVMDGFESTTKIRAFEQQNKLRPANIAALTGVSSEEARTSAFNAGVNKYLVKPIRMSDLTCLVTEIQETGRTDRPRLDLSLS